MLFPKELLDKEELFCYTILKGERNQVRFMAKFLSKLSVPKFVALGFLLIILIGSLLLMLPIATENGETTTYLNALFTSTSATCVTGLVRYDTATHWSLFGEIVIIVLIQIGGLGFMAFVSVVFEFFRKNMGLYQRRVMMQSTGETDSSSIRRLIRRIFIGTFVFEGIGALFLSIRFVPLFGWLKGIYYAVWHSISAFCNAGFDLMGGQLGEGKFASFTHFADDPLVVLTLCFLIIVGGLGFCVWSDLWDCRKKLSAIKLHTRVILLVSALLVFGGMLLFLLLEWNSPAMEGMTFGEKLLASLFCSVSPRTAGMNTVELSALSEGGYLLSVILMFIGGCSGSTAGGLKVGTLAVIVMGMLAVFREKRDINIGKKRIEYSLLHQALAIFTAFLFMILTATLLLLALEPGLLFHDILFEAVSALGTVGLSLSVTPALSAASAVVLMLLMFAGRVGILTLVLALGSKRSSAEIRKPLDTVLIG